LSVIEARNSLSASSPRPVGAATCSAISSPPGRWALLAVYILAFVATTNCALVEQRRPSQVSQGRRFHTAAKEFDEFFVGLHEAQVLVERWPEGEREPRRKLLRRLGLEPDASSRDVSHALANKIRDLESSGLYLKMIWSESDAGGVDADLELDGRTPSHAEQRLVESIEAEGKAISALCSKLHHLDNELYELTAKRQALSAKVDDAFQAEGVTKRQIVHKNLDDAAQVLGALALQIETSIDELETMIAILEDQIQAEPPPEPAEDAAEKEEAPAKPRYKPRRSRPRATPPPDKPPANEANDDFEP